MKEQNKKDDNLFGFGGFIEKLVDLTEKLKKEGEIIKEGQIDLDHIRKDLKGVYGISIKTTAGNARSTIETFGNIRKTPEGPKIEPEREPLTDIFDEKDELVIIAEMPGIEEKDIKIDLAEDILDISAERNTRKYHKELLLPVKGKKESMNIHYNNGILEIRIKK